VSDQLHIAVKALAYIAAALMLAFGMASAPQADETAAHSRPPAGLMWNRTGLPAVFPLVVKSRPGADYVVVLVDTKTGVDALSAYIVGGEPFRVLVPPGTFLLRFTYGTDWTGEDRLFGAGEGTGAFVLPGALTFEIEGFGTKKGHLVDLSNAPTGTVRDARVGDLRICQSLAAFQSRNPQRLDRFTFAQQWMRHDRQILPSHNGLGARPLSDYPKFEVDPLARLSDQNLDYLRYRTMPRAFDYAPYPTAPGLSYGLRSGLCP